MRVYRGIPGIMLYNHYLAHTYKQGKMRKRVKQLSSSDSSAFQQKDFLANVRGTPKRGQRSRRSHMGAMGLLSLMSPVSLAHERALALALKDTDERKRESPRNSSILVQAQNDHTTLSTTTAQRYQFTRHIDTDMIKRFDI